MPPPPFHAPPPPPAGGNPAAQNTTFGSGAAGKLQQAMGALGAAPFMKNAADALAYVMKNVSGKDAASLSAADKTAIEQAINQMKSLVGSGQMHPGPAQALNGAIATLQSAL